MAGQDHAYYKSSFRTPSARQALNQVSRALREHLLPGDCFYTDGSIPRPADSKGMTYARLAVCAVTSY